MNSENVKKTIIANLEVKLDSLMSAVESDEEEVARIYHTLEMAKMNFAWHLLPDAIIPDSPMYS